MTVPIDFDFHTEYEKLLLDERHQLREIAEIKAMLTDAELVLKETREQMILQAPK